MKTQKPELKSLHAAAELAKNYFDLQKLRDEVRQAESLRTPSNRGHLQALEVSADPDAIKQRPHFSLGHAPDILAHRGSSGIEGFVNHFAVAVKQASSGGRS